MLTNTNEFSIRATRQEFNNAIALHDTTHIAAFFTEDYTIVTALNFEIKGIEGARTALDTEFRTKKEVIYVRTPTDIQIFEAWNMASETGQWTGQWEEADGLVKLSGTYYAKWHKVNGSWKIRAEVFTPLTCSGSTFCKAPVLQ